MLLASMQLPCNDSNYKSNNNSREKSSKNFMLITISLDGYFNILFMALIKN